MEKEEAGIVHGSQKAIYDNDTVVIQSPLGVSMVRNYAHKHKSSLRGSGAFVRQARMSQQQKTGSRAPSGKGPDAVSVAGSSKSRQSARSARYSVVEGDRPPIKEIIIPDIDNSDTLSNVSYPTTPHHSLAGSATEQVVQRLEEMERQLCHYSCWFAVELLTLQLRWRVDTVGKAGACCSTGLHVRPS